MLITINRLYNDKWADIRDYLVREAVKRKENIVVVFNNKKMTLTPEDLRTKKMLINKTPIRSKVYLDQYYYLWSYLFVPDKIPTKEEQWKDFSIKCL